MTTAVAFAATSRCAPPFNRMDGIFSSRPSPRSHPRRWPALRPDTEPSDARNTTTTRFARGVDAPLHVHVGAGKLALGLLLPAMVESTVPFVVLQAPRDPWDAIFGDDTLRAGDVDGRLHVELDGRDRITLPLLVIDAERDVSAAASEVAAMAREVGGVFVVSPASDEVWLPLLSTATSISTSVGPALVPWLGREHLLKLPRRASSSASTSSKTPMPRVFACENDADAVAALALLLRGRADVVPCVVDKVCSRLEVTSRKGSSDLASTWTACVTSEAYPGMILPLVPTREDDGPLPFAGEGVVHTVSDAAAAEFLHQKKLTQVNGTHTALAFTTMCEAADRGDLPTDLDDMALLPVSDMSARHAEQMWDWAVCEALELLLDHGLDVAKRAYKVADDEALVGRILGDARVALERLSRSAKEDTVGRVLNAGVMLRLEGRLKTVNDKLQREIAAGGANMGDAHRLLLAEAGVEGGLDELGAECDALFSQCAHVAELVDKTRKTTTSSNIVECTDGSKRFPESKDSSAASR